MNMNKFHQHMHSPTASAPRPPTVTPSEGRVMHFSENDARPVLSFATGRRALSDRRYLSGWQDDKRHRRRRAIKPAVSYERALAKRSGGICQPRTQSLMTNKTTPVITIMATTIASN